MTYFPACPPLELMAPASVPITALIPNDPQPGLMVPMYPPGICPEIARFRVGDYVAAYASASYVVPLYSNSSFPMERFTRPVSAIVGS